jgi:hypothetical protein
MCSCGQTAEAAFASLIRAAVPSVTSMRKVYAENLLLIVAVFEEEQDPSRRSFFSEIISSISDAKFSADGRYIIARDYMSVKV